MIHTDELDRHTSGKDGERAVSSMRAQQQYVWLVVTDLLKLGLPRQARVVAVNGVEDVKVEVECLLVRTKQLDMLVSRRDEHRRVAVVTRDGVLEVATVPTT